MYVFLSSFYMLKLCFSPAIYAFCFGGHFKDFCLLFGETITNMDTCTSIEMKFTDVTIKTAPTSPHKTEQITTSSGEYMCFIYGFDLT